MDDKCRCKGEPVAWLRSDELRKLGHPYSDAPLNSKTDSMMLHAKGTQEAAAKYGHDVPVFTAPQPHQIPDGLVPIFQIKLHSDTESTWHDATQSAYDVTPTNMRRTLYTSPQPKQQVKGVNSTHTPSKPVKCVGCEGSTSSENSPCGVCGKVKPVAYRWRNPIVDNKGITVGYSDWIYSEQKGFLDWWPHESLCTAFQIPEDYKRTLRDFFAALDKVNALDKPSSAWVNRPNGSFGDRLQAWAEVNRLRAMLEAAQSKDNP